MDWLTRLYFLRTHLLLLCHNLVLDWMNWLAKKARVRAPHWPSRCNPIHWSLTKGCVRALAWTFAGRAKFASLLCGGGKLELTESAREFQKVSAPQSRIARSEGEEATGPATPNLLFLRLQHLLPLLEHPVDRLRGTGIQAEAAAFQAAGGVELVGRRREPGAGRADGDTDGLMGAAVGMADEVIANDHHRFDSFKETLGKDLEHVSIGKASHFHSFTSSFKRSFNSGCCSRLL